MNGLLNIEGAAQHLSQRMGEPITVRGVRNLQYTGRLPYLKIGGRIRFDPAELDRFIEDCRRPAKASAS